MYFIKDIENKKFLKEIIINTCKSLTNKNTNKKGFTIVIYHKFGIITTYRGLATSFVWRWKALLCLPMRRCWARMPPAC